MPILLMFEKPKLEVWTDVEEKGLGNEVESDLLASRVLRVVDDGLRTDVAEILRQDILLNCHNLYPPVSSLEWNLYLLPSGQETRKVFVSVPGKRELPGEPSTEMRRRRTEETLMLFVSSL